MEQGGLMLVVPSVPVTPPRLEHSHIGGFKPAVGSLPGGVWLMVVGVCTCRNGVALPGFAIWAMHPWVGHRVVPTQTGITNI